MEIEKNKNNISDNNSFINSINVSSVIGENELLSNLKRKKRRSKNDPNGRMFKCECGKAYLSALALSNHIKSKHSSESKIISDNQMMKNYNLFENFNKFNHQHFLINDEFQKKRGRPRKKYDIINNNKEINYHLFFHKEHRRKKENDFIEIKSLIPRIFHDIYEKKKDLGDRSNDGINIQTEYEKIEDHIFFNYVRNKNAFTASTRINHLTSDEIFLKYLEEISVLTNKEYFIFVFKFIVIFRDCINKYKNIELENSILILQEKVPENVKEFTQFYDTEQIPELCNEFLTEYLTEEYIQLKNEYLSDFIEIIQHFCHWLFENNYSSSRLLLNNY